MATSALQERRKRLVNRVGRHLPCNTIQVVSDFANVATKVVGNILANPEDVKFRELRSNNKAIQRAVLGCHGGREFLHLLGFEKITKHGEAVYFLAEPQLDHLSQAKDWLAQRVKACEATEGALGGRICADSVVTIILTSGQTLEGGFYKHETVYDVYGFLLSSVVSAGEDLRLCMTKAPSKELGENTLQVTLADAKMLPRATLAVLKPTAAPPPPPDKKARLNDAEEETKQLRLLQEYSARKKNDAQAEKEKSEVMEKFRADHAARAAGSRQEDGGVEETKGGHR